MITYCEPVGGLCNRMRAIASVYEICEKLKTPLIIVWFKINGCYCNMDSLFALPDNVRVIEILAKPPEEMTNKRNVEVDNARMMAQKEGTYWDDVKYREMHYANQDCMALINQMICEKKTIAYIKSCYNLISFELLNFNIFKPADTVKTCVEKALKYVLAHRTNYNLVGLHIRRTDNQRAIEYSPSEWFEQMMEKEAELFPTNTVFWVSSDDVTEKERMMLKADKLGGYKVLSWKSRLDRNDEQGIIDAYIELLCLANCDRIYGSYWSSFSEVAAAINKIPLRIRQP